MNPLPKALHGDDRHKCASGGAEVWRREGAEFGGVALEASAVQSQLNGANAMRSENAHARCVATGREAGLRSTWDGRVP